MQVDYKLGRENAAIETLWAIGKAEQCFKSTEARYGTLRELTDRGLLEIRLEKGKTISGYIYTDSGVTETTYCAQATRASRYYAYRDFNIDESDVIRASVSKSVVILKKGEGSPISARPEQ